MIPLPLDKKQQNKKKSACASDDSFTPNGNMAHGISRFMDHELELCYSHYKCYTHIWATDRKPQKHSHAYFCPACSSCVCVPCHRFLRICKGTLGEKI